MAWLLLIYQILHATFIPRKTGINTYVQDHCTETLPYFQRTRNFGSGRRCSFRETHRHSLWGLVAQYCRKKRSTYHEIFSCFVFATFSLESDTSRTADRSTLIISMASWMSFKEVAQTRAKLWSYGIRTYRTPG